MLLYLIELEKPSIKQTVYRSQSFSNTEKHYIVMINELSIRNYIPFTYRPIKQQQNGDSWSHVWPSDHRTVWGVAQSSLVPSRPLAFVRSVHLCTTRREPASSKTWWPKPRRTEWRSLCPSTLSPPTSSMRKRPQEPPPSLLESLQAGWWDYSSAHLIKTRQNLKVARHQPWNHNAI